MKADPVADEHSAVFSQVELRQILPERMGKGQHLNHVTIYRILDLVCMLNLAHRVLLSGGFVRCTLGEKLGCHRFMVCRHCGGLQEFADKALCEEENEIAQGLGFRAEHHFSEFFGVCSKCQR